MKNKFTNNEKCNNLILIIATLVFSCIKTPPDDGHTIDIKIIQNHSSHTVKIKNLAFYSINLPVNESHERKSSSDGFSYPANVGYSIPENDSLEVIYDDTLTLFHGSKIYSVFRDLKRNDMYNFKEEKENNNTTYTYTYTFTNADFEEAKTK